MKSFLILLVIGMNSYAGFPSQREVRTLFRKAATNENACRNLVKQLQPYNEKNNPLLAGYRACATMLMAKYVFNPFTRLSNFSKGRTLLEKSIAADKENIELRFLRYAIQTKAPFFLNYRSSLKEDEGMITGSLSKMDDNDLKTTIVAFLKQEKIIKQ